MILITRNKRTRNNKITDNACTLEASTRILCSKNIEIDSSCFKL